jgi:hypothetical protein
VGSEEMGMHKKVKGEERSKDQAGQAVGRGDPCCSPFSSLPLYPLAYPPPPPGCQILEGFGRLCRRTLLAEGRRQRVGSREARVVRSEEKAGVAWGGCQH